MEKNNNVDMKILRRFENPSSKKKSVLMAKAEVIA